MAAFPHDPDNFASYAHSCSPLSGHSDSAASPIAYVSSKSAPQPSQSLASRGSCAGLVLPNVVADNQDIGLIKVSWPKFFQACGGCTAGFQKRMRASSHFAYKVPDAITNEDAAPLMCAGVALPNCSLQHRKRFSGLPDRE